MSATPYGSWPSPITPELMTSSLVGLDAPALDGTDLYWLETRADQGGRSSLWRRRGDGTTHELTPRHYVRSRVHEYGGGEYAVEAGVVVFSDFTDGRLYVLGTDDAPSPLTGDGADVRFADIRVHADRGLALAIREDHRNGGEPENTLVAIRLDSSGEGFGRVLCTGADFYATPELAGDGRLAWVEWDHPNMPWDETRLMTGRLTTTPDGDLAVEDATPIAGGPAESAIQPRWTQAALLFASDRSGFWNLYATTGAAEPRNLHPADASFAEPQWVFGQNPYAVLADGRLLCTRRERGHLGLGILEPGSGRLDDVDVDGSARSLSVSADVPDRAAAVVTYPDRPPELVLIDLGSGSAEVVRVSGELPFDRSWVSLASPVSWPSDDGEVFGWFYPPTNPQAGAGADELPPLMTLSHGGPTGFSAPDFKLAVQFWTTRGVAVLDVNYGGSAGYGRAYRERLRGRWGIVDVRDCAEGAAAMGDQGRADPARLAIMGGSAGGYTTLRALTATQTFAAGISLFGVGDLETLARDTHKFESRYLDGLVGPYPAERAVYQDRSPINHVDDLAAPILLLQGSDDKVVPPNQAEAMAAAARAKRLPVALVIYPGEGHGFRRAESIKASHEAQISFLGQIFGFTPAGDIPVLEIENL
ncbi:S9 family peptidase [Microlunatus ginsengisoli]|uniref:S9 family peptidase n=1 Tax=Microlunatus ginsengisoli TaxID=363863 RepID=A0ABP6ZCP4_9ACTN